jgi:5-hydroxyisourate hydrolase-like protein (transthyretin family)
MALAENIAAATMAVAAMALQIIPVLLDLGFTCVGICQAPIPARCPLVARATPAAMLADERAERARVVAAATLCEGRTQATDWSRSNMSVSISVIDGVYGRPAAGISVSVSREANGVVAEKWHYRTGEDGCVSDLMRPPQVRGSYILNIDLEGYFSTLGYASLFSVVTTRFRVADDTHDHQLSVIITPASCTTLKVR